MAGCLTLHYDFQVETEKLPTINGVKPVSPEQEELIHRLVYFQNEYEQPSEEDLKRITVRILEFRNLPSTCTGYFRKGFTTLKTCMNLFRGHVQCFELL
jgi:hypothetical protein